MALSKNFTVVADSAVDADSPVDVALMTNLRDNDIHLEEWLGKDYAAETNHHHDGVNSKSVGGVQIMLNDTEYSTTSTSFVTVKTIRLYIPADLTTFTYTALTKILTLGHADMRLNIGATNGTTVAGTTDGTTYAWNGEGTIDVSALSGWQTFNIQLLSSLSSSHTAYLQTVMGRLT